VGFSSTGNRRVTQQPKHRFPVTPKVLKTNLKPFSWDRMIEAVEAVRE
jgi:hypothetical protein